MSGREDPDYGPLASYAVLWTFWQLPRLAEEYARKINRIWITSELQGGAVEVVSVDHLQQVLTVRTRVVSDDLLRAIQWASMLVFGLFERAELELPPSAAMLAEAQAEPALVHEEALR